MMSNVIPMDQNTLMPSEDHYVRSKKSDQAYQKKLNSTKSKQFTFYNMAMASKMSNIPNKYLGYLLVLQTYLGYEQTLVIGNKNRPMKRKDIKEVLGISYDLTDELTRELKKYGVLGLNEDNKFAINNDIHYKGKQKHPYVIKLQSINIRKFYHNLSYKSRALDLGFIFSLLPYVHLETNALCHNPIEPDFHSIIPLKQKDIINITGSSERTVRNKLNKLSHRNSYIFKRKNEEFSYYEINPLLFSRNFYEPDKEKQNEFLAS